MICLDFDWQIDEFMVYCRSTQLRPQTMKSYEQTLRLFERWCLEQMDITTVDKVTESVIRHYIRDIQERGKYTFYAVEGQKETNHPDRRRDFRKPVATTSINNYIRNLRVFFNWLDREYIIKRNPMKKIRQLKVNRKAKEFLSDDELRRLLTKMDRSYYSEHRDYVMIMLMLDSGMRLGECSCLLVEDLELSRRRINLRAEITKGRQDRTVFFSEKTEKIVRRWLQYKDRYVDSDYLFPVRERGSHIQVSNFESNFKKYLIRAGLNDQFTPHCLRNNFAKRCLMNGMDIYLNRTFDLMNQEFFESVLARPTITIQSTPKAYGHFSLRDDTWISKKGSTHEINIGAGTLARPIEEVCATLLHEMVHYFNYVQGIQDCSRGGTYHNRRFRDCAEAHGLIVDHHDNSESFSVVMRKDNRV